MTYDELIAKLEKLCPENEGRCAECAPLYAIHAIAELHGPFYDESIGENICLICPFDTTREDGEHYPCMTMAQIFYNFERI